MNDPRAFSLDLQGGSRLDVVIEPTRSGPIIHATEHKDGAVIGRIDASLQALARAAGIASAFTNPPTRDAINRPHWRGMSKRAGRPHWLWLSGPELPDYGVLSWNPAC